MATRFYLPSSGAAAVSPAVDAAWDANSSSGVVHYAAVTTPISSTMTFIGNLDNDNSDLDIVQGQWVSSAIDAQTISAQTIKFQMRAGEASANNNLFMAICIRVVSNDGSTVRGTVLALARDGTEITTIPTYTNRQFSATSSSVSASANDRIVIEIGCGGDPLIGGHDYNIRIGDSGASDLPENDTDTNDYNPWVEFANSITFAGGGGGGSTSPAWISSKGGQW